jgi:hypothetical protein
VERKVSGPVAPGTMPRAEGGGGMRERGCPPPAGRGTTLTGRGGMLAGADGADDCAESVAVVALGSFSSPIEQAAAPACRVEAL